MRRGHGLGVNPRRRPALTLQAARTGRRTGCRAPDPSAHHAYNQDAAMIKRLLATLLAFFAFSVFAADANNASQADLEAVKGIGPAIATKIVDERKNGAFKDWPDLITRVKGIGDKNAAKFSGAGLTVNGAAMSGAPAAAPAPAKTAAPAKAATPAAVPRPAANAKPTAATTPAAPASSAKELKKEAAAQAKAEKASAAAQAKADKAAAAAQKKADKAAAKASAASAAKK
jgi:competence protein ComEA